MVSLGSEEKSFFNVTSQMVGIKLRFVAIIRTLLKKYPKNPQENEGHSSRKLGSN
jgi:hypothetical protein